MVRRRETIRVTMFPFLSVLCTVIGVMVLFIVLTLSTRIVDADPQYRKSEKSDPRPGTPDNVLEGISEVSRDQLRALLVELTAKLGKRQEQLDSAANKLAGLEDLLEFKKTELFLQVRGGRPRELAKPEPVAMVPAEGFEVPRRPTFVEVKSDGYTVCATQETFPPVTARELKTGRAMEASPELRKFLSQVDRKKRREYLVFLIHPNGVEVFGDIRSYLGKHHKGINLGWEPFSPVWIMANPLED